MQHAIFYGCGKWLGNHWDKLLEQYIPLCIADANFSKQGTTYREIEVLSPETAFSRFPNADIFVTLKNGSAGRRLEAIDMLIHKYGINKGKILNYEDYYYGYGCPLTQSQLFFQHNSIRNCCENPLIPNAPFAMFGGEQTLENIVGMKQRVMDRIREFHVLRIPTENHSHLYEKSNGAWEYSVKEDECFLEGDIYCCHCHEVRKGYFTREHFLIDYMQISSNSDSVCNFKCPYCCEAMPGYVPKYDDGITDNIINAIKSLAQADKSIELDDRVHFCVASGEPAMYSALEKIASYVPNAYYQILTNASIYSNVIQNLISRGGEIVMSLDAGTPETFAKIKGVDCWNRVLDNLRKYRQFGSIVPKFIIQPGMNDNEKDIDGFVDFCKSISPLRIEVVRDWMVEGFDYDAFHYEEKTKYAIAGLIKQLEDAKLPVTTMVFPKNWRETLEKYI